MAETSTATLSIAMRAFRPGDLMDEDHFYEIESVLLYIAEARQRAAKARETLHKAGAEPHMIGAIETAEAAMRAEHRRLVQATHFATPGQDQLAV